jgi:hypothetical protein
MEIANMNKHLILLLALCAPFANADKADVVGVEVRCEGDCRFDVSLRHADSGWDHYADRWEVVAPDGRVLATRILYHPHVNEQPFTRSLSGVDIPAGIDHVIIRGRDSVHGYGGLEQRVDLPAR